METLPSPKYLFFFFFTSSNANQASVLLENNFLFFFSFSENLHLHVVFSGSKNLRGKRANFSQKCQWFGGCLLTIIMKKAFEIDCVEFCLKKLCTERNLVACVLILSSRIKFWLVNLIFEPFTFRNLNWGMHTYFMSLEGYQCPLGSWKVHTTVCGSFSLPFLNPAYVWRDRLL